MKKLIINNQTVFVESFKDLTETQKQELASALVKNEIFTCCTYEVAYILEKSYEDENVPFSWDDITLSEFAEVEIRGDYIEVCLDDEEEVLESLKSGLEILNERVNSLETFQSETENDDLYDRCDDIIHKLNERIFLLEASIDNLENAEWDRPEVFEWWSVSSWLASKLDCVISGWGYWGRMTTGQSIYLDYNIQKLAFELYSFDVECTKLATTEALELIENGFIDTVEKIFPKISRIPENSAAQCLFVQVANNLYKRQRTYNLKRINGFWLLDVLNKEGEIIDNIYTGATLGGTPKSMFYKALEVYLKDCC